MPNIDFQLSIRPKQIKVSDNYYTVNIFVEETLAISLDSWYTSYQEAEKAAIDYILERLN